VHELREGEVFAGHRIDALGGRGGMGIVYRALHLKLERTVALKVISPELASDEGFRQRFQREAQLAASIDHPNVINIYDADEADDLLYITMRWVTGTDLGGMLERYGRLEAASAVRIVSEVGFALDAAHARGLVHRDIKPANVLIAEGDGHVYLTDFGLTREAGEGGDGLTRTGMFVGTTDYAAPEQIKGGRVDARTDVYALGCVLVQSVTGRVPYDRDSEMSKMWAHVNDPPPRLRERVAEVPEALDEVVERALAKDPDDRYPSTGDLARAAAAAIQERPVAQPERTVATGAAAPADSDAAHAGPTAGETRVSAPAPAAAQGDTPPAGFAAVTAPPSPPGVAPPPPPGPWTPPPPTGAPIPAVGGITPAPPATPPPPGATAPPAAATPPPPAATAAPQKTKLPTWALWTLVGGGTLVVLFVVLAIVGMVSKDDKSTPKAGEVSGPPIKVGNDPQDVAFTPGNAWVANLKDGTVTRIDTKTDKTRSIKAEGAPSSVVAGGGSIWAWIYNDSVDRIDVKTNKVSPYFDTGGVIDSITFGVGALWVSHPKDGDVTRIDAKTSKVVTRIAVPGNPSSIGTGEGYVWVATDKGVVQIDPSDNSILNTTQVGGSPGGVQVTNGTVYVATGNDRISRVDAQSGAVASSIPVGTAAAYYTIGAGSMWVSYPVDKLVKRIDLGTRKPIGTVPMTFNPQGLSYGEGRVWVIDASGDKVVRIKP
jgi:serine/threonine-protein kinase